MCTDEKPRLFRLPLCNVSATTIMVPGDHANSAMWQSAREINPDKGRMPAIGSYVVDDVGAQLIADWIDAVKVCRAPLTLGHPHSRKRAL